MMPQRSKNQRICAARTLMTALVLCWIAVPLHAAEEEARVLILNGVDPYLPAYLAIDSAMRESLANETARRIVFFSEPLDAQRFPVEALESEFLALLTKKYSAMHIDVVVAISLTALRILQAARRATLAWRPTCVSGLPGGGHRTRGATTERNRRRGAQRRGWNHRSRAAFAARCAPRRRGLRCVGPGQESRAAGANGAVDEGRTRTRGVPFRPAVARIGRPGGCGAS